jgi:hypothetical protein
MSSSKVKKCVLFTFLNCSGKNVQELTNSYSNPKYSVLQPGLKRARRSWQRALQGRREVGGVWNYHHIMSQSKLFYGGYEFIDGIHPINLHFLYILTSSAGVKDGLSRKDELYNDLIDEFSRRNLDWPKTQTAQGEYFIQVCIQNEKNI